LSKTKSSSPYRFFIWGLANLFFFYEFFLRVLPATVAKDIINSLDMTIEQYAFIGSAYYLTYSFMQIPVGLLLDRFDAKFLVTGAVTLCSLGALWFSVSEAFLPAFLSRLIIGVGSSFGFIALMIVTLNWFPRQHFAFLLGCGQFFGAVGPLCAGAPIAALLKSVDGDWRLVFLWVAFFGFLLSALFVFFFKGKPTSKDKILFVDKMDSLWVRLKSLLSLAQVWWTLSYAALIYVTVPILGAFWGVSYLEAMGFNKTTAAFIVSMLWLGLAVGSPIMGKLSDSMKRRKPASMLCALIGLISSLLFLLIPLHNEFFLGALFFLMGFAGSGQTLSFAIMSDQAPKVLRATAVSLNNTAMMGFAAIVPPLVTLVIRHFAVDGQLTVFAFEKGFLAIPVCFTLAFFIAIFACSETFCRQQNVVHKLDRSSF